MNALNENALHKTNEEYVGLKNTDKKRNRKYWFNLDWQRAPAYFETENSTAESCSIDVFTPLVVPRQNGRRPNIG